MSGFSKSSIFFTDSKEVISNNSFEKPLLFLKIDYLQKLEPNNPLAPVTRIFLVGKVFMKINLKKL